MYLYPPPLEPTADENAAFIAEPIVEACYPFCSKNEPNSDAHTKGVKRAKPKIAVIFLIDIIFLLKNIY